MHAATIKICIVRQRNCATCVHASEFQKLACNTNWNQASLINLYYFGLRDEVQDLLLTMLDIHRLMEAISLIGKCDNCLHEQCMEKRHIQPFSQTITTDTNNFKSNANGSKSK